LGLRLVVRNAAHRRAQENESETERQIDR